MKGFNLDSGVLYPIFVDLEPGQVISSSELEKYLEDEKVENICF